MYSPNCLLLYVADVDRSVNFYAALLERPPVDHSKNFAMFVLDNGIPFGLWNRNDVLPAVTVSPGGMEIAIQVDAKEVVDKACGDWRRRGIAIVQDVTDLDFGRTFVGLDVDGHRLRLFALHAEPAT